MPRYTFKRYNSQRQHPFPPLANCTRICRKSSPLPPGLKISTHSAPSSSSSPSSSASWPFRASFPHPPPKKWEKGGSGDFRFINHLVHFISLTKVCVAPFTMFSEVVSGLFCQNFHSRQMFIPQAYPFARP